MDRLPKKDYLNAKEELIEFFKHSFPRAIFYSVVALAIYFIGGLSWWLAFVLFIFFSVYILSELVVAGSVFLIGVGVLTIVLSAYLKLIVGRRLPNKADQIVKLSGYILALLFLSLLVPVYLLFITYVVGNFLFGQISSFG